MPGGRPPKYKTPEEMQMVIDDYFGKVGDKPTMSGLALELGMSRQALCDYAKKDEFLDTIKSARLRVEAALEQHLFSGSVAGVIFNLKNNFGWKDKTEVEQNTKLTVVEVQSDFD